MAFNTSPYLTFFGPDDTSQVKAMDQSGFEVARFMVETHEKSTYSISRLVSPGVPPVPICTSIHKSSLTGHTTLVVHGREIKMRSTGVYELDLPMGKLKWRGESGSISRKKLKLVDADRNVVGRADLTEKKFDVFVPGDEMMLDCILASWIALYKAKKVNGEGLNAAIQVISALGGGGG